MNRLQVLNHTIAAMAKGHAYDELAHAQALAEKDRRIAELEKRVADLESTKKGKGS